MIVLLFIALPEVTVHDLSEEWDFIVLGCDGIWDVLTNQAVVNFIIESVAEGKYPENICEELLTYCLAPVTFLDRASFSESANYFISCFILGLSNGRTWWG